MLPNKRTGQNDPEWYRKSLRNRSGGRFLDTSGSNIMREIHFLSKTNVSKANYSKPFWQTHHELTHRVYLKHRNSISKIFVSPRKIVGRSLEVNVNKVNDKVNDIYSIHSHYKGGGRWPPPQKRCRGLTAAAPLLWFPL